MDDMEIKAKQEKANIIRQLLNSGASFTGVAKGFEKNLLIKSPKKYKGRYLYSGDKLMFKKNLPSRIVRIIGFSPEHKNENVLYVVHESKINSGAWWFPQKIHAFKDLDC